MSRLVKKALHPFSREKPPPTSPPPALKEGPVPPLTGDPVTLAIIGAGERGKASSLLVPSAEPSHSVSGLGIRRLRSQPLSLLQGSCSSRTSFCDSSGLRHDLSSPRRECLRIAQGTPRRIRRSRQGREAKDCNGGYHLRSRSDACRTHNRVCATGLSCALRKAPGSGRKGVYRGCRGGREGGDRLCPRTLYAIPPNHLTDFDIS